MTITIIGAGVFGSWSAWFLQQAGHRVRLVDAYGPANSRASSADHSRVIRCGYGSDAIYSQWARRSLDDWQWLGAQSGRQFVVPSGALFLGAMGDRYLAETERTLNTLAIPIERLEPGQLARRFPQISTDGLGACVVEPEAGVIRARAAVQSLVQLMRDRQLVEYSVAEIEPLDESRAQPVFRLTGGDTLVADAYVGACGPWLPRLFPHAIGSRIRPTRQEVLHFGVPAGDDRFSIQRLPVWIDFQAGLYGIPDLDAHGFKVGIDRHGPLVDPDTLDRVIGPALVDQTRAWLATRFPDLRHAPLVEGRVCQYENTSTGDFVIDRHPQWPHVWIVGGGSGHGFKHGPAVGRYLAALIDGIAPPEPRFALTTKTTHAARAVY